ncbi:MAG: hypothetical protein ACYSUY_13340 [Planctomycetota bacterium]|jgi:hypothetical protein
MFTIFFRKKAYWKCRSHHYADFPPASGAQTEKIRSRLAGYADTNDAERLCVDPAMRHVAGGRTIESKLRWSFGIIGLELCRIASKRAPKRAGATYVKTNGKYRIRKESLPRR